VEKYPFEKVAASDVIRVAEDLGGLTGAELSGCN